ncbi:MAG: hypothetical protein ACI87O_001916 [Planctomycetota bacterium]
MNDIIDFDVLLGKERQPRKPRSERSWLKRLAALSLVLVVVLALGARIGLAWWLPQSIVRWGEDVGLRLEFEDIDCSLLTGKIEFQGLRVHTGAKTTLESAPPMLTATRATCQVDLLALARGELHFQSAQLLQAQAHLHRDTQGLWEISKLQEDWMQNSHSSWMREGTLASVSIPDLHVFVHDPGHPVLDGILSLQATNPRMPRAAGHWELQTQANPWLGATSSNWEYQTTPEGWSSAGQLQVSDLHIAQLATWLKPLGVTPAAQSHDIAMTWSYHGAGSTTGLNDNRLHVENITLDADGVKALRVDGLTLEQNQFASGRLHANLAKAQGLELHAQRAADGSVLVAGLTIDPSPSNPEGLAILLQRVEFPDAVVHWRDDSTSPSAEITATLRGDLQPLAWNSKEGFEPSQLNLEVSGAELCEALIVTGAVHANLPGSCDVLIKGDGLDLRAISPYLADLGLESQLQTARMDTRLEASWEVVAGQLSTAVSLRDFYWKAAAEVARINELQVRYENQAQGYGVISDWMARGCKLVLKRDSDARLSALGFTRQSSPATDRTFGLADGQLHDVTLTLQDQFRRATTLEQSATLIRAHLHNWNMAGSDANSDWDMELELPGIAKSLTTSGEFGPVQNSEDEFWTAEFAFTDLQNGPLADWLAHNGLQSDLQATQLAFKASSQGRADSENWLGNVALEDVQLRRGEASWLNLQRLSLEGLQLTLDAPFDSLQVDAVRIDAPEFSLTHQANGDWLAAGLSWSVGQSPKAALLSTDFLPRGVMAEWIALVGTAKGPDISIVDAQITLRDELIQPAVETRFKVQVQGSDRSTADGNSQQPLPAERAWSLLLQPDSAAGSLSLSGSHFTVQPATYWQAELAATGSSLQAFSAYLPAAWEAQLRDAELVASWQGEWRPHAQGGFQWSMQSDHFSLTEAQRSNPLLAYEQLSVEAARIDFDAGVYNVGPIACSGLELELQRTSEFDWQAVGLTLKDSGLRTLIDSLGQALSAAEPARNQDYGSLMVGPIELEVRRLGILDESVAESRSAQAQGRLSMPGPFTWGYDPEDSLAPLAINLQGAVDGMLKDARLELIASPFAPTPSIEIDFSADGLQGRCLSAWLPESLGAEDCADLQGGRISGHLGLDLQLSDAQRPWATAFKEGLGAYLTVENFKLLRNPISPPLIAFDLLQVRAPEFHWPQVRVERVDVLGARGQAWKDAHGLHLAGFLWKEAPSAPWFDRSDLAIEECLIQNIQWDYEDRTLQPSFQFPVRDGRVQVNEFATQFREGAPPIRLNATLHGGEVPLPFREPDTLEALRLLEAEGPAQAHGNRGLEARRAFERIDITGRLSGFGPSEASLQVDASAFELATLAGLAREAGLTLESGLLDQANTLRLQPEKGLTWTSTSRVDLLSLQESHPCAFTRERNWPCDMPTFLQGLWDEEGGQRLTLQLNLPSGLQSTHELRQAVETSFRTVAQESHAKVQQRGLPLAPQREGQDTSALQIKFAPASAALTSSARADLARWIERQPPNSPFPVQLAHTFGSEDLSRASFLGTPPTEALQGLLRKLRQRKKHIAADQQQAILNARQALGSETDSRQQQTRGMLLFLDKQQVANEKALDHVLHLLAPGSERSKNRRTRSAALSLAQLRQEAVIQYLNTHGWPASAPPIQSLPPQFTHCNPGSGGRILLHLIIQ